MTEYYWHCPILLSLFSAETLFKLLTAVLLETSLVFVHDNLNMTTSVIMSLKLLLRPFIWCFQLTPVMPTFLLDSLDAPQPKLVGLTSKDYKELLETTHEMDRVVRTYVFLD